MKSSLTSQEGAEKSRMHKWDKTTRRVKTEARKIEMKDYRMLPRETAQQKKYYASARARERRRQTKRVFQLFDLIEQQPGYRELSFR